MMDDPASVSVLEAHNGSIKGLHIEARSGDPSAVSVASTLESPNQPEESLLPSSSQDAEDALHGSELPSLPSACEVSDNCAETRKKDASDNDRSMASNAAKAGVLSPDAIVKNFNAAAENGKVFPEFDDLRPRLASLANSIAPKFDISGTISKILDEHRAIRDQGKDSDPPVSISSRREAYKHALRQGMLHSNNIESSFQDFPYYLR